MGGKGGGSAPQAPDYEKLADKQKENSMNNYEGALGNKGTWTKDANGRDVYTESLGDPSQNIINNSLGQLGSPVDLSNDAVTKSTMDTATKFMQPYWDQQRGSLDQKLANQGIDPNSQAGQNAMRQQSDAESRAMSQYLLTGREQAVNESLAGRNQNLKEAQGIMGLNNGQAPGTQGSDLVGAAQNQYGQDVNSYNQQQQSDNNLIGSLAGAGMTAGMLLSERSKKKDIKKIGSANNGLPIYTFRYKDDKSNQLHIGLMADDVEEKYPHAVHIIDGIKHVEYEEALK